MDEKIKVTCEGKDSTAFESSILQLGYKIIDSTWDDEADAMTYTVVKKWLQ